MNLDFEALQRMPPVERARMITIEAHKGQRRKFGEKEEYINHPFRVASQQRSDVDREVGWLHDVFEDTEVTEENLRHAGVGELVIASVKVLTRKEGETYFDYINRVVNSAFGSAVKVKTADLEDNMRDLKEGSMRDKYRFAYRFLTGENPPR